MDKAGKPVPKGNEKPVRQSCPQTAHGFLPQKLHQGAGRIHGDNGTKGVQRQPGRVDKLCGFENGLPHGAQQLVFVEQIHAEGQGSKPVDPFAVTGGCCGKDQEQFQGHKIDKQRIVGRNGGMV